MVGIDIRQYFSRVFRRPASGEGLGGEGNPLDGPTARGLATRQDCRNRNGSECIGVKGERSFTLAFRRLQSDVAHQPSLGLAGYGWQADPQPSTVKRARLPRRSLRRAKTAEVAPNPGPSRLPGNYYLRLRRDYPKVLRRDNIRTIRLVKNSRISSRASMSLGWPAAPSRLRPSQRCTGRSALREGRQSLFARCPGAPPDKRRRTCPRWKMLAAECPAR